MLKLSSLKKKKKNCKYHMDENRVDIPYQGKKYSGCQDYTNEYLK